MMNIQIGIVIGAAISLLITTSPAQAMENWGKWLAAIRRIFN